MKDLLKIFKEKSYLMWIIFLFITVTSILTYLIIDQTPKPFKYELDKKL